VFSGCTVRGSGTVRRDVSTAHAIPAGMTAATSLLGKSWSNKQQQGCENCKLFHRFLLAAIGW
jgi:hypothetical protein